MMGLPPDKPIVSLINRALKGEENRKGEAQNRINLIKNFLIC